MSRIPKLRTVCSDKEFIFESKPKVTNEYVQLSIEEFETIRLIDYANLRQCECADMMEVARTTVQAIYKKARFKLVDALINQKNIRITGGYYKLCNHSSHVKNCLKNIEQKHQIND